MSDISSEAGTPYVKENVSFSWVEKTIYSRTFTENRFRFVPAGGVGLCSNHPMKGDFADALICGGLGWAKMHHEKKSSYFKSRRVLMYVFCR